MLLCACTCELCITPFYLKRLELARKLAMLSWPGNACRLVTPLVDTRGPLLLHRVCMYRVCTHRLPPPTYSVLTLHCSMICGARASACATCIHTLVQYMCRSDAMSPDRCGVGQRGHLICFPPSRHSHSHQTRRHLISVPSCHQGNDNPSVVPRCRDFSLVTP